jgi:hypothetical protein
MKKPRPDLGFLRAMLVLASMSPVFLIWSIIGMSKIPDRYFIPGCLLLILIPHWVLLRRIAVASKLESTKEFQVDSAKDSKEQLLTYFLPLVLPLMAVTLDSWRGFSATLVLFCIMAFASWHLRVFYINIFFAVFGFRIFQIRQIETSLTTVTDRILITKRRQINRGDKITAINLGAEIYYGTDK